MCFRLRYRLLEHITLPLASHIYYLPDKINIVIFSILILYKGFS